MFPAGNKAKHLSLVNHTMKTIHHQTKGWSHIIKEHQNNWNIVLYIWHKLAKFKAILFHTLQQYITTKGICSEFQNCKELNSGYNLSSIGIL